MGEEEEEELPGFADTVKDEDDSNKTKKKSKKAGAFHSMGFSPLILKGIKNRGYKLPTPIQRKSIPMALEGRDVVAMARTGSGKTACFVLPILEKLLQSSAKMSAVKTVRALILSPTIELALQTLRFVRELGKYTGLRSNAVLGGDSMDNQFNIMHLSKPDIIVATPGRFLHLCVEMDLKLSDIEIVVFDEGDRLFELGFGEQLKEILARLPISRQTLLFSATLPSALVEFARAGLSDPVLIRLDVEWKLPPELWLGFVSCRSEQREAALLLILNTVLTTDKSQAVVFTATRHHCEYLHLICDRAGINSVCVYSGLDSSARKIATGKFMAHRCQVLLVTDVAARGLDMPALDNVINYHFPAKPKLFVHRVGRSARAGRSGRAISLVTADDIPHLLDLHLFLGSSPLLSDSFSSMRKQDCESGIWGCLPADLLEARQSDVLQWQSEGQSDISNMYKVCNNAWMQYTKCRESASSESNKRAKILKLPIKIHPFFSSKIKDKNNLLAAKEDFIAQMKNYRPKGTILEVGAKNDAPNYIAMKAKRLWHKDKIKPIEKEEIKTDSAVKSSNQKNVSDADLSEAFPNTISSHTKFNADKIYKKKQKVKEVVKDPNYIPHESKDHHTEMGLAVNFGTEAQRAHLDLAPDTHDDLRKGRQQMKWDRKRKKMVHVNEDNGRGKMIRTESGGRIPATYQSGRYAAWKEKQHQAENEASDDDDEDDQNNKTKYNPNKPLSEFRPHWVKHRENIEKKNVNKVKNELRTNQQILRDRLKRQKLKARKMKGKKGKGVKPRGRGRKK